ncbi:hypothetical protein CHS0354_021583 [Potamilus streckersoni]|uniref:Cadherin-like beta-sandwich-like domain-containing protein n=1 Tax=Potamilus streckersoni TaxID=2493646 RepID=A0AAE0W009_9BIVA|nr:hypothetical protein CHS0354_021583 [Potamilus streckersoni]
MDDCNLEKLSITPGKMSPAFHMNVTEYYATVSCDIGEITINALTRDSSASYSISGSGGSKKVNLQEGTVTDIKIEVTAEDGTVKHYFIHVKRLSARDATLSDIKLSSGTLDPEFSPDVTSYSCLLPCNVASVTVIPTAPDKKNEVTVLGNKPGSPTSLNVGDTPIEIEVTSADGSNKQVYIVLITKKQLPRHVRITDPELACQFECPISLSPFYRPITIRGSDPKHTFSAPIIDELTRMSKTDPLNDMPLDKNWRVEDIELEKRIAGVQACVPLTYGGTSDHVKFSELPNLVDKCNITPKVQDVKDKFKDTNVPITHKVEVRKWEKEMHQVYGETSADKLVEGAKEALQNYFKSLPSKPGRYTSYADGESPMDYLQLSIHHYATAIKFKVKDANLHLQLGMLLEEKYYAEDIFGLKKEDQSDFPSMNLQAKESSKEEECAAICKLRGLDSSAPLPLQLKAIDEEYHHLINNGQSAKADHVMELFQFKSKKGSQEGATAQKAMMEENPIGQAYLKYMDALALDEAKALYNFHVGRLLVVQGKYDDAVSRLEISLNWNPNHQLSRYYLGLALALKRDGPGARSKEAIGYLLEALETLLQEKSKEAVSFDDPSLIKKVLRAENLMQTTNVHLLRGIIQLGKLLSQNPDLKEAMSPQDVFHNACLLATQTLPLVSRGDLYQQLEWVILDAHSCLLDLLIASSPADTTREKLITQRCHWLSSRIFHSTIPSNDQLLTLQEKTCQKLVMSQPCSSEALYYLGAAQFARFENSPPGDAAMKLLVDAKSSFQCCINLEGNSTAGDLPDVIKEQQWWQDKVKEEEKKKAEELKKAEGDKTAPSGGGAAAKGGTAAGRGAPATRGRGTATPAARGGAAQGKGAVAASRGGATAARGGAKAAPAGKAAPPPSGRGAQAKPVPAKLGSTTSQHNCEQVKPQVTAESPAKLEEKPQETSLTSKSVTGSINRKSYHPRLGLARAHKAAGEVPEAQKYYNEVITMAPEVHDAYIESAEMLLKTNPLAAVDVYCKFPISAQPTFDDAFIIGEILRILMKNEKYDDPRLAPNMIAYGKALGLSALEKYIKILEEKFKAELLKTVYAGVNGRSVDDPDMQAFFKFKCWV